MDPKLTPKSWYASKTIWAGIVTAVIGIYEMFRVAQGWPEIPPIVLLALGSLGVYGRAQAKRPIA